MTITSISEYRWSPARRGETVRGVSTRNNAVALAAFKALANRVARKQGRLALAETALDLAEPTLDDDGFDPSAWPAAPPLSALEDEEIECAAAAALDAEELWTRGDDHGSLWGDTLDNLDGFIVTRNKFYC